MSQMWRAEMELRDGDVTALRCARDYRYINFKRLDIGVDALSCDNLTTRKSSQAQGVTLDGYHPSLRAFDHGSHLCASAFIIEAANRSRSHKTRGGTTGASTESSPLRYQQDIRIIKEVSSPTGGILRYALGVVRGDNKGAFSLLLRPVDESTSDVSEPTTDDATLWRCIDPCSNESKKDVVYGLPLALQSTFSSTFLTAHPPDKEFAGDQEFSAAEVNSLSVESRSILGRSTWCIFAAWTPPPCQALQGRPACLQSSTAEMARGWQLSERDTSKPARIMYPRTPPLSSFSLLAQEALLLEDVFFVLMGRRGQFITRMPRSSPSHIPQNSPSLPGTHHRTKVEEFYQVEPHITSQTDRADPSLIAMALHLTTIRLSVDAVCAYVENIPGRNTPSPQQGKCHPRPDPSLCCEKRSSSRGEGMIRAAFRETLRSLLDQYTVFVCHHEGQLRKHQMRFTAFLGMMQPVKETMGLLSLLVEGARELRGGALLNSILQTLRKNTSPGAPTWRVRCYILERVTPPMLHALEGWLHRGVRYDPCECDFFVQDDHSEAPNKHVAASEGHVAPANAMFATASVQLSGSPRAGATQFYCGETAAPRQASAREQEVLHEASERYWIRKFSLRDSQYIPEFLQHDALKILTIGKYLNILRSSAASLRGGVLNRNPEKFVFSDRTNYYSEKIAQCFSVASSALLDYFRSSLDLMGHLTSAKHFFLLDKSDFFAQFLEAAGEELEQPQNRMALSRVEALFEYAIRSSSTQADPYNGLFSCFLRPYLYLSACHHLRTRLSRWQQQKHQVKIGAEAGDAARGSYSQLASGQPESIDGQRWLQTHHLPRFIFEQRDSSSSSHSRLVRHDASQGSSTPAVPSSSVMGSTVPRLQEAATGTSALSVRMHLSWPMTLFFSQTTLLKYELLFRHLLFCKYVEMKLGDVWQDQQHTKELDVQQALMSSYATRQRMLHFCQNYIYYFTVEVVEPRWHVMRQQIDSKNAASFEQVVQLHEHFLDTSLKESLLTEESELVRSLAKILTSCALFAQNLWKFRGHLEHIQQKSGRRCSVGRAGLGGSSTRNSGLPNETAGGKHALAKRRLRLTDEATKLSRMMTEKKYSKMVLKFADTFDKHLQAFLEQLVAHCRTPSQQHLANLLIRLDFNRYYSSTFQVNLDSGTSINA